MYNARHFNDKKRLKYTNTSTSTTGYNKYKENFQKLVDDNKIWFGENRDAIPSMKRFLSEVKEGTTAQTIWDYSEVSDNQEARKEIVELFKEDKDHPNWLAQLDNIRKYYLLQVA